MTSADLSSGTSVARMKRRRPVEAIEQRTHRSLECERRVRKALSRLTKAGVPFTINDVCALAGVGKTFIYDKRHPDLTESVLAARKASQAASITRSEQVVDEHASSWRERALNAEAYSKKLKSELRERDLCNSDLVGQLYDEDGTHLLDENARLRGLLVELTKKLNESQLKAQALQRSLDAARSNVRRERGRNVSQIFADNGLDLR